ncbi:MAG: hypothetical protein SGPRY_002539, partial [Prymnesium sp.]
MRLLLSRFLPLLAPPSDQPSAALNALRAFGLVEWCNRLERSRQGRGEDFASRLERRLHRLLNSQLHLPSLFNKKGATSASPISASIAQLEGGGGCRLELGCGGGEWLCAQAGASPEAEARAFLEGYLPPSSLEAVYVNHPEPPQQSGGVGASVDGSHMLDAPTLRAIRNALQPGGTLTIVTDNS